jgi:hypothetical protein
MSNSKTAIQEIKSLMVKFGFMNEDLLSFKTSDNTIYQTSSLEVGNKIFKINEAFKQVSVKDGSYRFEENLQVEVKDEKIASIKELFLDAKLADGTVVKVDGDSLLEGAKVLVITEDAEIPAPDGVHELEDGTKIETKDGLIVKVEEVVAEVKEEAAKDEMGDKAIEPPMEPSLAMQKEVMELLKDFVSKMGEKMSQMEQSYSKLETEFKAFKKEPAGRKIADGKTEFAKTNNTDDELDARVAAIVALRNNKK